MSARLFLVDQKEEWLENYKSKFEKEGFEIFTATTCKDALEVANINARPDVFIINSSLPDGDGLFLSTSIKRENRLKEIPILVMKDSIASEEEYKKIGVHDFIAQPVTFVELLKKLLLLIKYGSSTKMPKKKSIIGMEVVAGLIVLLAVIVMGIILIGSNKLTGK